MRRVTSTMFVRDCAVGMKVGQARFGSEAECAKAIGAALDSFPQLMHEVIRTDVFHVDGRTMEESQILAHGH